MTLNGWLQIALFIALILLLAKPMGAYMTRVYERRRTWLDPVLVPCERLLYRVTGIDPDARDALDRIRRRHAHLHSRNDTAHLRDPAHAALSAAQPRSTSRRWLRISP